MPERLITLRATLSDHDRALLASVPIRVAELELLVRRPALAGGAAAGDVGEAANELLRALERFGEELARPVVREGE